METHSYWHKQTADKPLYPDIEWSKPEQKSQAGRIGIIGGNSLGFAGVAEAYQTTLKTGAGDEQNIGSWTSTHDFVEWTANVTKPGTFDVELNYACDPKSGGQVVLSADLPLRSVYRMNADDRNVSYLTAGNAKLNITIPPTKSWADFTVAKVGQLKLDKAGPVTLALKPVKKQGEGVLNLRSVVLKPRGE